MPYGSWATAACTKRMLEYTKGLDHRDAKGDTKDCFIFDSWLYSKIIAEAVMGVVAYMFGMVKTI